MVYRHPFHRLVSAFRDKLEYIHPPKSPQDDFFYQLHGRTITFKYRKLAEIKFGKDFFSAKNNFGAPNADKMGRRTKEYPIFWEFVQYVKSGNWEDPHWLPQTTRCQPCHQRPFQHIFYFEKSYQESIYLKHVLMRNRIRSPASLNEKQYFDLQLLIKSDREKFEKSERITKLYFDQLSDEDIRKLYLIYVNDFKLLGYNFTFRNITYK